MLTLRQVGVGVKGGAEAMVHAARAFVASASPSQALVKLDFTNAFNSVRRDAIFEAVADKIPEMLPYVLSSYESPSTLFHGVYSLQSSEGVQQGDPLGPLLFCLAIAPILEQSGCAFSVGYLDDIILGDTVESLVAEVARFRMEASRVGLTLNESKCEIVGLSKEARPEWKSSCLTFSEPSLAVASLLGAPLSSDGFMSALTHHQDAFTLLGERLGLLSAHEALFLCGSSLTMPKWLHLLRSSPSWSSPGLVSIDRTQWNFLSETLNIPLSANSWTQASLPVRWGGLGVRSIEDLAPSAFLASAHLSRPLVVQLLSPVSLAAFDACMSDAMHQWSSIGEVTPPDLALRTSQKAWDDSICSLRMQQLLHAASGADRARLIAANAPGSGSWIQALPCANLGLRLSNQEIGIAAGLRVGAHIVAGHSCVCGVPVLPDGRHGLSCRKSAGRQSRHHAVNDIIARALRSTGVPAILEPPGLLRGKARGQTAQPSSRGLKVGP